MKHKKNLSVFKYPRKIYNEGEVLGVYKKEFPDIVREYEEAVKKTYCNPCEFRKLVDKKAKKFDQIFDELVREFQDSSHTLENLINTDIALHKNYASNFWFVSYLMGEGPLAFHYVEQVEEMLKKVYPHEKEKYLLARNALVQTDFGIFYHQILMDSIKLLDLLNKDSFLAGKLKDAKELSPKEREKLYDKIISILKKSKQTDAWIHHLLERHWNNRAPLYNLLNQGLDFYQENILQKNKLKDISCVIRQTLALAKKKLGNQEGEKLKNVYLVISEIIRARDLIFGRKDPKLFKFWNPLTDEIIKLSGKSFDGEKKFLLVPWFLGKSLPKNLRYK